MQNADKKRTVQWILKLSILFAIVLATSIGFVALADEVHEGDTLRFDQSVLTAINARSTPFLDGFYSTVTDFGGVIVVASVTALLVGGLILRKKYKKAVFVAAGVGGAALINLILKLIFERARPDLWDQLIVETSYSFPSGHAMGSAAFAVTLIILLWNTKYRWPVLIAAVFYTLLIGFSRLYLGVHYPTDVVAGWLMSTLWVVLVAVVLYGKRWLKATRDV